ncbi:hypothetical protein HOY82DRAFT_488669 [Tuber indicum]|nr:hypothetical protein HOY82DRAFT_488669 [Tuber indicum]
MTDFGAKPRSGLLLNSNIYTELITDFLDRGHISYHTHIDFSRACGVQLRDHERARVTLMRVPFAPYYDTSFILKLFKTEDFVQAPRVQVEMEAASLHHAAEAFRRNNIGRVPRVYALRSQENLIAMERIHGRGYRDWHQHWWPKERMIRFVRQMAAIRIAVMTQVENQQGVPRHASDGGRVGPYCGNLWWDNDRRRVWDLVDRGPFPNRHEMILGCLRRDLAVVIWLRGQNQQLPSASHFSTWLEMLEYLQRTIRNFEAAPRPAHQEYFSLNHNDLKHGDNVIVRGSRIAALIDWETASYDPLCLCVTDLVTSIDFNPRLWREHAGPNGEKFHLLPYRMQRDTIQEQLAAATAAGAERKPFPDWELIENNGGPLSEADFCGDDYPEDISSADEQSIVDPEEICCDSDAEVDDDIVSHGHRYARGCGERPRKGPAAGRLRYDWYYEPVYALIKEFIYRQRGAGLGPDGEWGKLPGEYSRPLAEWEDPVFWRMAQLVFEGREDQIVDDTRVGEVEST